MPYELKMAIIASKSVILGLFPKAATAAKWTHYFVETSKGTPNFCFVIPIILTYLLLPDIEI